MSNGGWGGVGLTWIPLYYVSTPLDFALNRRNCPRWLCRQAVWRARVFLGQQLSGRRSVCDILVPGCAFFLFVCRVAAYCALRLWLNVISRISPVVASCVSPSAARNFPGRNNSGNHFRLVRLSILYYRQRAGMGMDRKPAPSLPKNEHMLIFLSDFFIQNCLYLWKLWIRGQ